MDPADLQEFWERHRVSHTILFPGGGRDTKLVNNLLCNYAMNKRNAMGLRASGQLERAGYYEANCERLYARLPGWARW
jgi:hypothetical protein